MDNTKDELYAILRRRLFQQVDDTAREAIAHAWMTELEKAGAIIERPTMKIREEILATWPFHFSTKHLIGQFNANLGFQKTRDVIRLMAAIVRSLWQKGAAEVQRHYLISLESADLNDATVSSRFLEIKKTLQEALHTDIANAGNSHAESLDAETDGLAGRCARWIYAASLAEVQPRGLSFAELAEYLLAPNQPVFGLQDVLKRLYDTCWYIEKTKTEHYRFRRHKNLNASVNGYVHICTTSDRDDCIADMLTTMFQPRQKHCYQKLEVLPALDQVQLERDRVVLVIVKPETDVATFFAAERYHNRVAFLRAIDAASIFTVNKRAERLWAIRQVCNELAPDDVQNKSARERLAEYQAELFIAIKAVFNRLFYPMMDANGDNTLIETPLLDSYVDEKTGHRIQYRNEEAGKGEFVVEATLRDASKFQTFTPAAGDDKLKVYAPLRTRVEMFLFPASGRTTWDQILEGAATRGAVIWTEPGTLERLRETLLTAGAWREMAGQLQKPPFDEITSVYIEHTRDHKTGAVTTTDIKLAHADKLLVREDGTQWVERNPATPLVSEAMLIEFKAVDSSGKNQEGQVYRIENPIDLHYDLLDSPTSGHKVVKIRVTPPSCTLLYSIDGSNPANNGQSYREPGIDAPAGALVRVHAAKGNSTNELKISLPGPTTGKDEPVIDPDKPQSVNGRAFSHLITRATVYALLAGLPAEARLQMVQAKVFQAVTSQSVTLTWDRTTRLEPASVMRAFEFLDSQLPEGEWSLRFDRLHFPTGRALLQWQVDASIKIAPDQID